MRAFVIFAALMILASSLVLAQELPAGPPPLPSPEGIMTSSPALVLPAPPALPAPPSGATPALAPFIGDQMLIIISLLAIIVIGVAVDFTEKRRRIL